MRASTDECHDCQLPVTRARDGMRWACNGCGLGGYYDPIRLPSGRVLNVRVVTRWRDEDGTVRHG